MLVLNRTWRRHGSRVVKWYRREQVWRRLVDYVVHGVLIGTLLASYVARVQRISTVIGADHARSFVRVAIDAIVALQGARAVLALMRDFVTRDGMPRAALARASMMSGHWWMQALGILAGCSMEFLWATHASAAGVSTELRWLVAAVFQYTLGASIAQWVLAGQVRRAAAALQRAARRPPVCRAIHHDYPPELRPDPTNRLDHPAASLPP